MMTDSEYQAKLAELEEGERDLREAFIEIKHRLEFYHPGDRALKQVPEDVRAADLEALKALWESLRLTAETKLFLVWVHEQELLGRPEEELTFGNCVRETGTLLGNRLYFSVPGQDRPF
jgi:hypothetical protein